MLNIHNSIRNNNIKVYNALKKNTQNKQNIKNDTLKTAKIKNLFSAKKLSQAVDWY